MIQIFFYWKGYFNKQLNEFETRKNNFNSQLISMISAEQSPTPSKKRQTNKQTKQLIHCCNVIRKNRNIMLPIPIKL